MPDGSPHAAYRGTSALVLGATGFIGQRMAAHLDRCGAHVLAVGRDSVALENLRRSLSARADTAECDLADADGVARLMNAARPMITFNLAGYGVDRSERDEEAAWRINAELPDLLAQLCGRSAVAPWPGLVLVHVGSALEYGKARGDLSEDTNPVATTLYGRSKLAGTEAVAARARAGLPAVTARLFTVYGPGEHAGRLLPSLIAAARSGMPLDLTPGTQERDFTFVDDVADGLMRLGATTSREIGSVVNLATGKLETVRGFAERAARVLGIDAARLRFGAIPSRPEEMVHDPVSTQQLRARTGWTPGTTIEEGVRRTMREMEEGT